MLKPEEIYEAIVRAGDEWADKDAAATILEETKKTVFAELFVNQPQTLSIAAREYIVGADPTYKLHVTNMVTARKDAHRARVRFDAAKLLADLRRSEETTLRAQLKNS